MSKLPAPIQSATPKQQRSRESHERVIAATLKLLGEEKGADFTLADVSRESGVSIGGIYGRFDNRMTLILEVQTRINEEMAQAYALAINKASSECGSARDLIPRLVEETAESLRSYSNLIKAIVDASLSDERIGQEGLRVYALQRSHFMAALLVYRKQIVHPHREQAIEFCFSCIYELVASHFGFGHRRSADDGKWSELVQHLQHLCVAFLMMAPDP